MKAGYSKALSLLVALLLVVTFGDGCQGPSTSAKTPSPSTLSTTATESPSTTDTSPASSSSSTQSASDSPQSQDIVIATNYLKVLSWDLYQTYLKFEIDDDIADYIIFTESLPSEFQLYSLENRLCIKDRKLTDLEKQFLIKPEVNLQLMFDSYVSEISQIDQEIAEQLKKLPYFNTLDMADVEAVEDFLQLARVPTYIPTLEKIFGKGIERKMHSIALEALLWRAYTGNYDVYNPLEDANYSRIFSRLAEFQENYSLEMDADIATGVRFNIKGMNYHAEPTGELRKNDEDYRFDIALMRWILGCNSIRLWGSSDINRALSFVRLANIEGLDVYFTCVPISGDGGGSKDNYQSCLLEYAKNAQLLGIKYFSVGNEIELWWKEFGGGPWASTPASLENRRTGKVASYVDELATMARQYYSGCVTYNDYHAADGTGLMNWQNLDAISLNIYGNYYWSKTFILSMRELANSLNITLYWTELGSLTISEAEKAGADDSYTWKNPVTHDEAKQAEVIEHWFKLADATGVDNVFVFVWDRSTVNNQNELGFGIWDCVTKQPKQSFWVVYRYFKER